MADQRPSAASRAAAIVFVLAMVGAMAGVSAAICAAPARRVWQAHVVAGWPVVQGEVGVADIVETHSPKAGKRAAWDGWCVRWNYAYDWRGERFHGRLVDATPSVYASGCFAYRSGAEKSAQRHPAGSALAVRVDPQQPQESSPLPAESNSADIVAIVFGLLPALVALSAVPGALRAKPRPGASGPSTAREPG